MADTVILSPNELDHPGTVTFDPSELDQPQQDSAIVRFAQALNPFPTLKRYFWDLPSQEQQQVHDAMQSGDYVEAVKTVAKALPGVDIVTDMAKAQAAQGKQVVESFKQGDYSEAAGHGLAAVLPVVGPQAAHAGEQFGSGDIAGGLGTMVGLLAPFAVGAVPGGGDVPITPAISSSLDPAEASAVRFADTNAIPLDAATRTGSPFLRNLQGVLQNAPGSASVVKNARTAQTGALTDVGAQLQDVISPATATPESAGGAVGQELQSRIGQQGSAATAAYGKLEAIENDPANLKTVQVGQKPVLGQNGQPLVNASGQPVTTPITRDVALPVDMRGVKQSLQPIADQIKQQLPAGQQQYSRGLQAVQNILSGDDVVPASVAEQNLSGLKAIQRDAVNAKTKWLATQAIKQYAPAVDAAVSQAGPAAIDALRQGRQLTAAKYATQATADSLQTEPVKLFNQLTSQKDVNINLLRDVAAKAPDSMSAVGRAYVEGLMDSAFAEAGQAKPGTVLTQWQRLGPETKKMLFQPQTIQNLNDFFTLAKKVAENPNPSGTAYVGQLGFDGSVLIHSPHLEVGYLIGKNAVARLLTNPTSARALVNGLRIPVGNVSLATLSANEILKIAGTDAQPADQAQRSEPPATQ